MVDECCGMHDFVSVSVAMAPRAIMRYHSLKMEEINKIIKELWIKTYRGGGGEGSVCVYVYVCVVHACVCRTCVCARMCTCVCLL